MEEGRVHKVFAENRPFRASQSHCADAEQETEAAEDTNPELVIARKPEVRQKKWSSSMTKQLSQSRVNDVPNPLANNRANR